MALGQNLSPHHPTPSDFPSTRCASTPLHSTPTLTSGPLGLPLFWPCMTGVESCRVILFGGGHHEPESTPLPVFWPWVPRGHRARRLDGDRGGAVAAAGPWVLFPFWIEGGGAAGQPLDHPAQGRGTLASVLSDACQVWQGTEPAYPRCFF